MLTGKEDGHGNFAKVLVAKKGSCYKGLQQERKAYSREYFDALLYSLLTHLFLSVSINVKTHGKFILYATYYIKLPDYGNEQDRSSFYP